jgi:hypothetical protein
MLKRAFSRLATPPGALIKLALKSEMISDFNATVFGRAGPSDVLPCQAGALLC